MKGVVGFVLAVIVLIVVAVYVSYGEIEPCKVLAIEQSRHAMPGPASTDTMSSTECVTGLVDSWMDRLK